MTEEELKNIFAQYGEVTSVRLVSDRETGRAKGFGFVDMADDAQATAAIEAVNGSVQSGRPLKVNEAKPREERPRREFGNRRGSFRGPRRDFGSKPFGDRS